MVNATLRFCFGCLEVAYKDCVGRGVEIGESTTSTCSTRSFRNDLMMQFLFSFEMFSHALDLTVFLLLFVGHQLEV